MAGSVNKVILVGNLGADPVVRHTQDGKPIVNLSIATSESWRDKASGERKERTEWHNITLWGKLAEIAGEYLKKGSQVYVEGQLRTRKYQDKETGKDRYSTEIRADRMQMLGSRPGAGEPRGEPRMESDGDPAPKSSAPAKPGGAAKKPAGKFDDMEDDIPF